LNKQYIGTEGLTVGLALNRIYEIMDKQPLGKQDLEFYEESKAKLEEINKLEINSTKWEKIKNKLTAKQLLYLLEGE